MTKLRHHLILNMTWVENKGLRTFCGRWVYDRRRGLTKSQFKTAMNQEGDSNLCYFCLNGSSHFFDSILSSRHFVPSTPFGKPNRRKL